MCTQRIGTKYDEFAYFGRFAEASAFLALMKIQNIFNARSLNYNSRDYI